MRVSRVRACVFLVYAHDTLPRVQHFSALKHDLCWKIMKSEIDLKLKASFLMYGENTKTIAIPIYRVLPYPALAYPEIERGGC